MTKGIRKELIYMGCSKFLNLENKNASGDGDFIQCFGKSKWEIRALNELHLFYEKEVGFYALLRQENYVIIPNRTVQLECQIEP